MSCGPRDTGMRACTSPGLAAMMDLAAAAADSAGQARSGVKLPSKRAVLLRSKPAHTVLCDRFHFCMLRISHPVNAFGPLGRPLLVSHFEPGSFGCLPMSVCRRSVVICHGVLPDTPFAANFQAVVTVCFASNTLGSFTTAASKGCT